MEIRNLKLINVTSNRLERYNHIPKGEGSTGSSPIFHNSSRVYQYKKESSILKPLKSHSKETNPNQLTLNHLSKIDKFKFRIASCKYLSWGFPSCMNCEKNLVKKPIKLTCLSPYCNEHECIKNRIRCVIFRLKEFRIRSKQLYNFVIGFEPVAVITKKDRIFKQKVFRYVMKLLDKKYQKRFIKKLYSISARDLNLSNNKIRLHYHVATLPVKDFKEFSTMIKSCTELASKKYEINLAPSFSGYKKTSSTLSYFAKRICGVFGHNRNEEQAFTYKDIMSIENYYKTFYKTKALNFFNLKFRTREASSELISMLNVIPKICPNCNIPTKNNIIFITLEDNKPPNLIVSKINNNSETVFPEIIKFYDLK